MVNEPKPAPLFRLGLIGYPLGHSFSADYFNSKFKKTGIPGEYDLYPIADIENFITLIEKEKIIRGLNVTIPYKTSVIPYLDELSEDAAAIGAVNVVTVSRDEKDGENFHLKGYNTDWYGFMESLRPHVTPNMKKALILGTGGSSRAVAYALRNLGIDYDCVTRSKATDNLNGSRYYTYGELNDGIIKEHTLIVNTTPVGMFPDINARPAIPYEALTPGHLCFDLIYNPARTAFINAAEQAGAQVKNGLEMLHLQAEGTWTIIKRLLEQNPPKQDT